MPLIAPYLRSIRWKRVPISAPFSISSVRYSSFIFGKWFLLKRFSFSRHFLSRHLEVWILQHCWLHPCSAFRDTHCCCEVKSETRDRAIGFVSLTFDLWVPEVIRNTDSSHQDYEALTLAMSKIEEIAAKVKTFAALVWSPWKKIASTQRHTTPCQSSIHSVLKVSQPSIASLWMSFFFLKHCISRV